MKVKRLTNMVIVITLILGGLTTVIGDNPTPNRIIYVDDDGGADYTKIQDAINNSNNGDTIFVYNGIYYENIILDKSLELIGMNCSNTIIDGGYNNSIIHIIKDNTFIRNFTIRFSGGYNRNSGIFLDSDKNSIKDSIFYQTKTGIFINRSNYNEINNCNFYMDGEGILLKSSGNNNIKDCYFEHNAIGINIANSFNNVINSSTLHTNGIACFFNDSKDINIINCNISDNIVNIGGVFIVNCSNIRIKHCIIRHNGAGISISSSVNVRILNCDLILNTHFAVAIRETSNEITISQCEISDNFRFGIYLEKDNSCKILNNNICNNTLYGLYSKFSNCNAQYNWWGSFIQKKDNEIILCNKITWKLGYIEIIPWHTEPLFDVGANMDNNLTNLTYEIINAIDKEINLIGKDTDEDGVPDWWETKWGYNPLIWNDHINLDKDNDALNNFEECYTDKYGSNPFHKDIFLEIDWMVSSEPGISNKPPKDFIDRMISSFEKHNITLHIDLGALGGGEEIPMVCTSNYAFGKLRDIYWDFFLHNNITNPRKGIFHYGIICNYCPDLNFPFVGWDHFDSFAISAQWLKDINPLMSRGQLIVGGIFHHIGHTLGLLADMHDGIDNIDSSHPFSLMWWKYRNYKSCMNYRYKYKIFSFSDGNNGQGDFDDWNNLDFGFFKNSHFEFPKK